QKPRKEKDKERDKERKLSQAEPNNERLKTVVRRLPPNLPEEIFWQSVQPWVSEDTTVWKIYYPGKLRKRANKENIPSRAYIGFKAKEQLALFSREYDGHLFRDKTGAEFQAVVEFAPYPKIPSEKRKPDNRNATIEKDEDFISFVESLKRPANAEHVTLESLIASTQPIPQPKSTPLLEALKAEKSANKDKEAILRNHAHYSQIIAPASRKEDKKKGTPAPQPQASKASEGTSANVTNHIVGTGGKKSSKKGQAHVQGPPPISPTLPKVASAATDSSSAPKNPTGGPGAEPTKPVKAPRAPRVIPQSRAPSNNSIPNATVGDAPSAEAPARRSRPVIGLASRQFEAALSGVAGRGGRAKGEKGREKESLAPASNANDVPSGAAPDSSSAAATTSNQVEPPSSPKKERTRRGGGGRHKAGDSGGAPPVKISGILQRVDTSPSAAIGKGVSEGSIDVGVNSATGIVVGSGNRGSGRRGRGHMKDKGVAPPTLQSGG
ncbi:hypothetical protein BYT27DRAFT_7051397, partial [Phlegmacium glaucopus]